PGLRGQRMPCGDGSSHGASVRPARGMLTDSSRSADTQVTRLMSALRHVTTRRLIATVVPVAALAALAATPHLLGHKLVEAANALGDASPGRLWLAVAAFLASVVCTAFSWRSAICATGAEPD